ncbi:MAG: ATP-binding region, ATPase domain protein [Naasia sp.]|jgi:signal transduction histidine kinase|uniref:sensor histidine kinase n=1 Tax=Naasia sp. TaxID=2546198 RepID=UPI00261D5DCD|nr:ATP-binding protein [Naasia sp.]MCU1569362.1 ATP-binding region, ATPase domain protein [Naasia sp.]
MTVDPPQVRAAAGLDADRAPWWQRFVGVRARSAVAASLIVAVALAVASGALILLLQRTLADSIDAAVTDRIREVASQLQALPDDPSTPAGADAVGEVVRAASRQGAVLQVLSSSGSVVGQSPQIEGEPPLAPPVAVADGLLRENRTLPVQEEELFHLVSSAVDTPTGTYTVIAAQSLEPVDGSTSAVLPLLATGYPILLAIVGGSTFWLVGRSLRPVEAIRAKVARIGGHQLGERVPVPPTRDEVARLAVTMNEMLDRLEAAQLAQRRFVADASHELRSPVATLKASAEVALLHPQQRDDTELAEGFVAEATRLERLVNDLLLLAHADERGLPVERRQVDLDDLLTAELERMRAIGSVEVTARIEAVQIWGSPHQLAQLLRNLVDNALSHAASSITLTLRAEGGKAVLEVLDDGPGIPPELREQVFDRFVRLDESRGRAGGGTGLGLAIVREIVHAHSGTVAVVDSDVGAALRVVLPVTPPGSGAPARR